LLQEEAIGLDEQETSCQVVACFIPHSMIWPDQPQWSFIVKYGTFWSYW